MLTNVEGRVVRYGVVVNGRIIEERLLALNHLPYGFDDGQEQLLSGKKMVKTPVFVAGNSDSGYIVEVQPGWTALHTPLTDPDPEPKTISGPAKIKLGLDHRGKIDLPGMTVLFQMVTAPPQTDESDTGLVGWLKGFFRS